MAESKQYGWVYKRRPRSEGGRFYDEGTKMKAVATYLATGNRALTGRMLNIPKDTLKQWAAAPWWSQALKDFQIQEKLETNRRLANIRDKALGVVVDRLENGNFIFDQKTGQVRRVPVNAKDAHKIAADMLDKEDLLEARVRQLSETEEKSTANALSQLADAFAKMSQAAAKKEKTIEVDITDVELRDD